MGKYGEYRALVKLGVLSVALALTSGAADACRLALVLAMDISNSVDEAEDALQRAGLARALIDSDVQAAFFASPDPVNLLVFEWSGQYNQQTLVDWTVIDGPEALLLASNQIAQSVRSQRDFPTAMGYALGYAATRLRDVPECQFRTIDVSGDGKNNHGFGPELAYKHYPFDGVTVNGLVITANLFANETGLVPFYETEVLRGPGAFVEIAAGFEDYADAMRRKLLRELMAQVIGTTEIVPAPRG